MNSLAHRNPASRRRFRAVSCLLPSEATQRQQGDGRLILGLAAQRLDDLGLTIRAKVLRELADKGDALSLRAEGFYDLLRIETPDSERPALLAASARYIAHGFAQGTLR